MDPHTRVVLANTNKLSAAAGLVPPSPLPHPTMVTSHTSPGAKNNILTCCSTRPPDARASHPRRPFDATSQLPAVRTRTTAALDMDPHTTATHRRSSTAVVPPRSAGMWPSLMVCALSPAPFCATASQKQQTTARRDVMKCAADDHDPPRAQPFCDSDAPTGSASPVWWAMPGMRKVLFFVPVLFRTSQAHGGELARASLMHEQFLLTLVREAISVPRARPFAFPSMPPCACV